MSTVLMLTFLLQNVSEGEGCKNNTILLFLTSKFIFQDSRKKNKKIGNQMKTQNPYQLKKMPSRMDTNAFRKVNKKKKSKNSVSIFWLMQRKKNLLFLANISLRTNEFE